MALNRNQHFHLRHNTEERRRWAEHRRQPPAASVAAFFWCGRINLWATISTIKGLFFLTKTKQQQQERKWKFSQRNQVVWSEESLSGTFFKFHLCFYSIYWNRWSKVPRIDIILVDSAPLILWWHKTTTTKENTLNVSPHGAVTWPEWRHFRGFFCDQRECHMAHYIYMKLEVAVVSETEMLVKTRKCHVVPHRGGSGERVHCLFPSPSFQVDKKMSPECKNQWWVSILGELYP